MGHSMPATMSKPRLVSNGHEKLLTDADRCLIREGLLLSLSNPDAAGLLERRSNISGWYRYWYSLHGSQLLYFERTISNRRGLLVGTISLFRHKLTIINSQKRRREFEITDLAGKVHILRADSDAQLHCWVQLFEHARNKIPPAHPIASPMSATDDQPKAVVPNTVVDTHVRVDHVLCVVHGIGVDTESLSANIRLLQESYADVVAKVFPDVDFGIELIPVHWRDALTSLDVHQKLKAVVPRAPVLEAEDTNPLKYFMEHRVVDYVYFTHPRYRRHMLRAVCERLNTAVLAFRKRRPDYTGGISVMGHSLGSALCYELFSRRVQDDQKLLSGEGMRVDFIPDNLFCLGSPLGTLKTLDGTIGAAAMDMDRLPFRVFNVFKFHDPIATRLEPLRDVQLADVPPVTVPCWINMGLRESTAQWFGSFWNSQRKRDSGSENIDVPPEKANSNEEVERRERFRRRASAPAGLDADPTHLSGLEVDVTEGAPGAWNEQRQSESRNDVGITASITIGDMQVSENTDGISGLGSNGIATEKSEHKLNKSLESMRSRMDFALQVSSTIEEMSTSWSAIKSHTEYWGNRDVMLLMVSAMMKTTYGISDSDESVPGRPDVRDKIVNSEVLLGLSRRSVREKASDRASRLEDQKKRVNRQPLQLKEDGKRYNKKNMELGDAVSQVVDKIIDDVTAMVTLVRQHPAIRMRSGGGVGRELAIAGIAGGQKWYGGNEDKSAGDKSAGDKSAGDKSAGDKSVEDKTAGWAAYLSASLFGSSGSGNSGASGNAVGSDGVK